MIDISSRYLIILIFRSFFLFSFFFYALASLLLFATREIISRFEREEYFSPQVLGEGCSCYRRDSFVRILFIVEIEIVRGRDWIEYQWKFCLHDIDCIYLYLLH